MITSTHNPLIKHLVKLRENKKYREEQGSVLISGFKLVGEIAAISPPQKLFIENLDDAFPGCESYEVSSAVLKKITGLSSPEPIAAEFPLPSPSLLRHTAPILALDAIRDPGNLGTLLRTALALGWGGVFLLPTCVDPFNDKVVRASRGALFKLPWREGSWDELAKLKREKNLTTYIADLEGEALPTVEPSKNTLLVLSNEAQGIGNEANTFGKKITIPMEGNMESLNVAMAGAIIMYHLNGDNG